jgi:hypothetical protein
VRHACAATRIVTGVGDLVQSIRDSHIGRILDSRTIGRSNDAMCSMYHAHRDEKRGFLS